MAFADSQGAATIIFGEEPAEILLKGTVVAGDILGYRDGWKRALATAGSVVQARCIAAEPGDSGDKIEAYFGRVLMTGRFTGGTDDASLYVAEGTDNGKFTEIAPTDDGDANKRVGIVIDAVTILAFPNRDADSGDGVVESATQAHKDSHQDGGTDEISVTGLSGLLADDQHVLDAEVIAVAIAKALLTTRGDIIYRNATVPARLAKGTEGQVLTMGADDPAWAAAPTAGDVNVSGTPTDGQVAIWTDADTIEGSAIGTIKVAASDATAAEKAAALASGGAVCNGTDDWDDIATAITAAGGGTVQLSSGQFELDQNATETIEDANVVGSGSDISKQTGTILNYSGNSDSIRIKDGGRLQHLLIQTPTNFSGIAVVVMADDSATDYIDEQQNVLFDVIINGDRTNQTGTGLQIKADTNGHTNSVQACTFPNITIDGYNYGLHLYADEETGKTGSVNGNIFPNLWIAACQHFIVQETVGTGSPEISGNQYYGQLNCNTLSDNMIECLVTSGAQYANTFSVNLWDTGHLSSDAIVMEAGASYNFVIGDLSEKLITGAGLYNQAFDVRAPSFTYRKKPGSGLPSGERIEGTLGATLSVGDIVHLDTNDRWEPTDADAESSSKGTLGIVMVAGDDGDKTWIHLKGPFKLTGWTINEGVTIFLSTTLGGFTETAPSGASDIVRVIGYGIEDADIMFFDPSPDYFEHDGTGINKINGIAINV